MITAFRVAVYDVMVISNAKRSTVTVRFRLYKGIALAFGVWFISGFMVGSMFRWESILLPMGALLMFNGLAFMVIRSSKRKTVAIVQRWASSKS